MKLGRPRKLDWNAIAQYLLHHPRCTAAQAARVFSCSAVMIKLIARDMHIVRGWVRK